MPRPSKLVTALLVACLAASTLGAITPAVAQDQEFSEDRKLGIVDGTVLTPADDTPWLAAILTSTPDPTEARCTGVLITDSHVLTAAHCVTGANSHDVAVGILDLTAVTPADRMVGTPTVHPSWTGITGTDLAILTLAAPDPDAVPLSIRSTPPLKGDPVTAYGWGGLVATGVSDSELLELPQIYPDDARWGTMAVTTDPISADFCGFSAGTVDHSHQFCFDGATQAACFGDSGGPVVIDEAGKRSLVGITVQGPTICNDPGADEIAERSSDAMAWIQTITGCLWNDASAGAQPYAGWAVPCWAAPAFAVPFTDVDQTAFYDEAVRWLWANSITTGTSATTFSPDDAVARGQLAALLWRFAGRPATNGTPFADVTAPWQLVPVAWLAEWGFTTGVAPGVFDPDGIVTRGQLVTFLWRLLGTPAPASASSFPDVTAGQFYSSAVAWAAENGVTTGYPDGTFKPDRAATRGEVATFLLRLARLVEST